MRGEAEEARRHVSQQERGKGCAPYVRATSAVQYFYLALHDKRSGKTSR